MVCAVGGMEACGRRAGRHSVDSEGGNRCGVVHSNCAASSRRMRRRAGPGASAWTVGVRKARKTGFDSAASWSPAG